MWKLAPFSWEGFQHLSTSFEDWWRNICLPNQGQLVQERIEIIVYLLWYIWKARCAWKFENKRWEAWEIIQKAMSEWQEYQNHSKQSAKPGNCRHHQNASPMQNSETLHKEAKSLWHVKSGKVPGGLGLGWTIRNQDSVIL